MDIFGQRQVMSALKMTNAFNLGANVQRETTSEVTDSLKAQQAQFLHGMETFATKHLPNLVAGFDAVVTVGMASQVSLDIASRHLNTAAIQANTIAQGGAAVAKGAKGAGMMMGAGKLGLIGGAFALSVMAGIAINKAFQKDAAKSARQTAKNTKVVADKIKRETPVKSMESRLRAEAEERASAVFSARRMANVNPQAERDMKTMIKLLEDHAEYLDLIKKYGKQAAKKAGK